MSLPDGPRPPVLVPESAATLLQEFESRMLRDKVGDLDRPFKKIRPYADETFTRDRSAYVGLVDRIFQAGLVSVSTCKKATTTPLFVRKKHQKQRLVIDCRLANMGVQAVSGDRIGRCRQAGGEDATRIR